MTKHGIEHFHISILEECSDSESSDREIYWIEKLNSYQSGYNATKGGDGISRLYLPNEEICSAYLSGDNSTVIAKRYGCDPSTVIEVLHKNNVCIRKNYKACDRIGSRKKVEQIDLKTGITIRTFNSIQEASMAVSTNGRSHITEVCRGQRKSAHGYSWRFSS